jgi:hypothetical protein
MPDHKLIDIIYLAIYSQILCSVASNIAILSRNIDQLIALANCNRREQIAILTC